MHVLFIRGQTYPEDWIQKSTNSTSFQMFQCFIQMIYFSRREKGQINCCRFLLKNTLISKNLIFFNFYSNTSATSTNTDADRNIPAVYTKNICTLLINILHLWFNSPYFIIEIWSRSPHLCFLHILMMNFFHWSNVLIRAKSAAINLVLLHSLSFKQSYNLKEKVWNFREKLAAW